MASRWLVAGGTGNWNDNSNWASVSGGAGGASFPVAGDVVAFDSLSGNANLTVNVASACASLVVSGTYAGTLTFNSTLTLTSTCTFVSGITIAGTAGTLILTGAATLTSAGKTLTCALTLNGAITYTLADDWAVNGLVTVGPGGFGSSTINGAGRRLTCNGGLHVAGFSGVIGTAKLTVAGGTWDSGSTLALGMDVELAGNVTVSGTIIWGAGGTTLKYVSGTITTTGSTLNCSTASTFNTAGVTWNILSFGGAVTYTLTSALSWSGTLAVGNTQTYSGAGALSGTGAVTFSGAVTLTLNNTGGLVTTGTLTLPNAAFTFAGTSGFAVGTLNTSALTASRIYTLQQGNTYTVNNAFNNVGTTSAIRMALKSSSAGNRVVFNVTAGATFSLSFCDPTDIDSSGGTRVFSTGGTISNSLNWAGIQKYLVSGGTGNWDSTSNWAYDSGGSSGAAIPVAGDVVAFDSLSANANMTVNVASACASLVMSGTYAGTLTFTSTLTLTSTCTFVSTCTIAGTAGALILNGTATITSAGKTLSCALSVTNFTITLADNWTVNGLTSAGTGAGTTTLNGFQITCAGGFRNSAASGSVGGTTKLVMAGGTWDASNPSATLQTNVDLAGTVTVSGTLNWGAVGKTLKYVSGTITTTGSTISLTLGATLDTAGLTWANLSVTGAAATYTLSSNLAWNGTLTIGAPTQTWTGAGTLSGTGAVTVATGTLTLNNTGGLVTTGTMTLPNNAATFAGSAGFTVGTLTTATLTASRIYTLQQGNVYVVTTSLASLATSAFRMALKSSSPGNKVVFTLGGAASQQLAFCDPTDIDSSAGQTVVSIAGVITTTTNWVNQLPVAAQPPPPARKGRQSAAGASGLSRCYYLRPPPRLIVVPSAAPGGGGGANAPPGRAAPRRVVRPYFMRRPAPVLAGASLTVPVLTALPARVRLASVPAVRKRDAVLPSVRLTTTVVVSHPRVVR